MSYIQEFRNTIEERPFPDILQLWDEYRSCDAFDSREFVEILALFYNSAHSEAFGAHVETALAIWERIQSQNERLADQAFSLIVDLETTNSSQLAETCLTYLRAKYGDTPNFEENLRFVGLKNADAFQGAIRNFQLLTHMTPGHYVFHTAGWGVGEINDISPVREQVTLEFENVYGVREITFQNAFQTLIPLSDQHFLARRFGDPDQFEIFAKKEPLKTIHILLRDFGPKTAAEIKEELCEWVIPKKDWSSWWQSARNRLKKDGQVACPATLKEPFRLRKEALSHEEGLAKALSRATRCHQKINLLYTFARDFPERVKLGETRHILRSHLAELSAGDLTPPQRFEILLLESDLESQKPDLQFLADIENVELFLQEVQILALKKRFLMGIRAVRGDWQVLFADLFLRLEQNGLREYVYRELCDSGDTELLSGQLNRLLEVPNLAPEAFIWYFQKVVSAKRAIGDRELLFGDKQGQCLWLHSLLILLSRLELSSHRREIVKRIHALLTGHKFAIVRQVIQDTDLEYLKEFYLLVTKCYTLSDHDVRIMKSLAAVVQPQIAQMRSEEPGVSAEEKQIIWATPQGLEKVQRRLEQIGTVEIVENAKEIEAARAHGDLRENSEYKFALEKRARLQSDLRTLSQSINRARLLTPSDISTDVIGVGCSIDLQSREGQSISYTILGPWEADSDKNVISHQSKLAQILEGRRVGEPFQFQGENYTVKAIRSALV